MEMFGFLQPFLRNAEMTDPVRVLYKGTLRILLLLLHDEPEFLCDFHFSFCDICPPSCVQLRNLILSAFPRNMRLPDPFTPNLKVDLLPETSQLPRLLSNHTAALTSHSPGLMSGLESFLRTRSPADFLQQLSGRYCLLPADEAFVAGTRYNIPLINSLVLYLGINAVQQLQSSKQPQSSSQLSITQNAPMDILQRLVIDLDTEGKFT